MGMLFYEMSQIFHGNKLFGRRSFSANHPANRLLHDWLDLVLHD